MDCRIIPLSPSLLRSQLPSLVLIDRASMIGEIWEESHYLSDLPGKWECSALAYESGQEDKPVGFIIASMKPASVHVHRLAVDPLFQGRGMGKLLLQHAAYCATQRHISLVTLKVAIHNEKAIGFYERLGFQLEETKGENLALHVAPEVLLRGTRTETVQHQNQYVTSGAAGV